MVIKKRIILFLFFYYVYVYMFILLYSFELSSAQNAFTWTHE